jgi:hypothetical protein
MGKKRIIELNMKDGSVKKLQLTKSTSVDNDLVSGSSIYIEANKDGTYRLAHGSSIFDEFDDIVSINIVRQDFK